jgi:hypothetical protein
VQKHSSLERHEAWSAAFRLLQRQRQTKIGFHMNR